MTGSCVKIVVQKTITGERTRVSGLTSDEALEGLKYVLYDIFGLSPSEIPKIFSIDFMQRYDIYRYYRLIQPPRLFQWAKFKYVLSKLCPGIVTFNYEAEMWNRFLLTIKDKSRNSFWKEFHDVPATFTIVRRLLPSVFLIDSLEDLFVVCDEHADILMDIIKLFRLDDFYELFCMCLPDFIFGCFTEEEKKKYIQSYIYSRLKYDEGKEIILAMMDNNKELLAKWSQGNF